MECVVNVSEGCDADRLRSLAQSCASSLLDVQSDCDYGRSVFTLASPQVLDDVKRLAHATFELVDFRRYHGVHPALGALDVVPFVPLKGGSLRAALDLRDQFGEWLAAEFGIPVFRYGEEISLPALRRGAFMDLAPTWGPDRPHPVYGATCVGARGLLVAMNVNLAESFEHVRSVARSLRSSSVRTLALRAGRRTQVSMNLLDPLTVTPLMVVQKIKDLAKIESIELVGLMPAAVLDGHETEYWALGLDRGMTIEARLRGEVSHS